VSEAFDEVLLTLAVARGGEDLDSNAHRDNPRHIDTNASRHVAKVSMIHLLNKCAPIGSCDWEIKLKPMLTRGLRRPQKHRLACSSSPA